jgi:hypothetical protein
VSLFCPEGYVPILEALFIAAKHYFPEQIAGLEKALDAETEKRTDIDAAVRAFSQQQLADTLSLEVYDVLSQTVYRFRNFLHQGTLEATYFAHDGPHHPSREFWATAQADGVIESGSYWPFGKPGRWHEQQRPNYPLFVKQSELDALLTEQAAQKPPLPSGKMPDLIAALRTLDHLPNREKQREALRNLPEFERYHLTDEVLREAEQQVPRKPGRKSRRPQK